MRSSEPVKGLPGGTFLAAFLRRALVVAALGALFLPFFGPALDHHFAERQPHHVHVYLAGERPHHIHFYQENRHHFHDHRASNRGSDAPPAQNSDIVYLTSNEGLGQSVTFLAFTSLHVEVDYPAPGHDLILAGYRSQDSPPPAAFVPPPEKPPRA